MKLKTADLTDAAMEAIEPWLTAINLLVGIVVGALIVSK
jgi:hypothetical protein